MGTDSVESFATGAKIDYLVQSVENIPSKKRRGHKTLQKPLREVYGIDVSEETAGIAKRFKNATDATMLIRAVDVADIHERDNIGDLIPQDILDSTADNVQDPGPNEAIRLIDDKVNVCNRELVVSEAINRSGRENVYIPKLICGDGDVYMSKSLSSTKKVRMAWDLDDNNEVVVVDRYDVWENPLDWKKLKSLPHGKNKIREELGGALSDDVLEIVATSDDSDSNSSSASRGRRTRADPPNRVLNLAKGRRQRDRKRLEAKCIAEGFEGDGERPWMTDVLVLFPRTADRNMTDHWWVPGRIDSNKMCTIAHCNKSTFEYLNQYEEVWHIEDYIEQSGDYTFETVDGTTTLSEAQARSATEKLILHVPGSDTETVITENGLEENMVDAFSEYQKHCSYDSIERIESGDGRYALLTKEDMFWMRPALRSLDDDEQPIIVYDQSSVRDVGDIKQTQFKMTASLYAIARLPRWDTNCTELQSLRDNTYSYELEHGAMELIETLAKLHDAGKNPYSEGPENRWLQK